VANERIGQVVGSPSWIVKCASEVDNFRRTLSPEEAELFNECLARICRDPHVDKIRKFQLRTRLPIVDIMYRDDNFMLVYYYTQAVNPNPVRKIYVFRAALTRDFGEGDAASGR
jgi:hypothetical protein